MSDLRIVLFGMASAGKTSLLGALAQAGQTQQQGLGGQLADPGSSLGELKKLTYEGKLTQTTNEVVEYPVTLQAASGGEPTRATIVDCDGRLAGDYLSGRRSLDDNALLAKSLREADALILVLAPTSDSALLEQAFIQFNQFLKLVEQNRSRRSEIAGLPVYLVLTKCDLLARKEDSFSQWVQRVEDGKQKIAKRFKDFLSRTAPTLPFGNIQLNLWATAIRRPALGENTPRSQEPYAVAELFRQALDSARAFHERRSHAYKRLQMTLLGMLAVIAVMGLVALGFYLARPSAEIAALENRIRNVLPAESKATDRLRDNSIDKNIQQLTEIKNEPVFGRLPSQLQQEVEHGLKEMTAYKEVSERFKKLPGVRFLQNDKEMEQTGKALEEITLPTPYGQAWGETRLAKNIDQYRTELNVFQKALADEVAWLGKQTEEGESLRKNPPGAKDRIQWFEQVDTFLKRKERHDESDRLPEVSGATYQDVYAFQSVKKAHDDWERTKKRLTILRDNLK